jgi:hypothetical protein
MRRRIHACHMRRRIQALCCDPWPLSGDMRRRIHACDMRRRIQARCCDPWPLSGDIDT